MEGVYHALAPPLNPTVGRAKMETDTIIITIRLNLADLTSIERVDFIDEMSRKIAQFIIRKLYPDKKHVLGYGLTYGPTSTPQVVQAQKPPLGASAGSTPTEATVKQPP